MIRWLLTIAIGCSGASKVPSQSTESTGGASCEPGRCLDDVARAVKERRSESRACYDAAAAMNPALEGGRLIINFRIDAEGAVTETSQGMQDDQLTDEMLFGCVSDVIKTLRFAKSPSGKATRAYHQFEFSPR